MRAADLTGRRVALSRSLPERSARRRPPLRRRLRLTGAARRRELRPDVVGTAASCVPRRRGSPTAGQRLERSRTRSGVGGEPRPRRRRAAPRQPRPRDARLQRLAEPRRRRVATTSRRSASCAACASTSTTPSREPAAAHHDAFALSKTDARSCSASRARRSTAGWRRACPRAAGEGRDAAGALRPAAAQAQGRPAARRRAPASRRVRRPDDARADRRRPPRRAAPERPRQLRLAVRRLARRWRTGTARRGGAYNRLAEPAWPTRSTSVRARARRPLERAGQLGTLYLNGSPAVARAQARTSSPGSRTASRTSTSPSSTISSTSTVPVGRLPRLRDGRRPRSRRPARDVPTGGRPRGLPAGGRGRPGLGAPGRGVPVRGVRRRMARSWRSSTPRRPASS